MDTRKQESDYGFLGRLGRTRVRPGGRRATEWLLDHVPFTAETRVLEVACGTGATSMDMARRYGCRIEAVDLDADALAVAAARARAAGLENLITFRQANALALPFADQSFDVLINEGMLTVLPPAGKVQCVQEYLRVLKPGGFLLTQDIRRKHQDGQGADHLLTAEGWQQLMEEQGLQDIDTLRGELRLMSLDALVEDEGWQAAVHILQNALQPENFPRWQQLYNSYQGARGDVGSIAIVSCKSKSH
ncbi:MAG: class I SAM-dependent methyltransferase [Acidaminococcus sp.]|uniref:class I SAM-dependent methyltransferase n=1 Tax=Acidaminococcus sp. TaxID=1872103 RepID=UPI0026DEC33E|nr:class I SAM-dependent methyltransferase [Acidaminococcus sp.]MDO5597598.1 class I SAM-dependent methyltransferase [Acidaminococcus sp.]